MKIFSKTIAPTQSDLRMLDAAREANQDMCQSCRSISLLPWMSVDSDFSLIRCGRCGLGVMVDLKCSDKVTADYTWYGDHITDQDAGYFERRRRPSIAKKLFFKLLKRFLEPATTRVMEFGGGAGFFAKSFFDFGYKNTILVEPSVLLRQAAVERVGLNPQDVVESLDPLRHEELFGLVTMMNVLEHLPRNGLNATVADISRRLEIGGYLLGVVPNANSVNVLISGEKDPSIAPPNHVFYFTKKSIDFFLTQHGFKKVLCVTFGVSSNSFFRTEKFKPSWVEQPTGHKKLFSRIIRLTLFALNSIAVPFGMGYHVIFLYRFEGSEAANYQKR